MLLELYIFLFLGICFGIISGLIPGIHINLISVLVLGISFSLELDPLFFAVFIIAMSVTHTFVDSIPSIFLGAPDPDMVLSVLPGHRLLLNGRGYEAVLLTAIGSLLSLLFVLLLMIPLYFVIPFLYEFLQPYIGWLLIIAVAYMIYLEKSWIPAGYVFLLSGMLGFVVFSHSLLTQPLFSMLSGLFGISTLFLSLQNANTIPAQKITFPQLEFWETFRCLLASVCSGSLTGLLPGLGSAQAAIIAMQVVGNISVRGFLVLIGGINTVNFVFSLLTLLLLQKARNGSVVAVQQIIQFGWFEFLILIGVCLFTGGMIFLIVPYLSIFIMKMLDCIPYTKLCYGIICFIFLLSVVFDGPLGFLVLLVSTFVGLLPAVFSVKRSLAMGCLVLPVVSYFLL